MYASLKEHCKDFHLYIFAFDEKCFEILKGLNLGNVTVIPLEEFEDEELLRVKPSRSKGEYCWTCTSSTIWYCLKKYNLENCTYVDSDLYFYSDPKSLVEEMGEKSVLITEHRFTPQYEQTETAGKYCVQFITFKNNDQGLKALEWWRNACIEWCYNRHEDGKFGDQKYLDDWTERFDSVHVLKHLGGGVAPWNVQQYDIFEKDKKVWLKEIESNQSCEVVFYHFHNIKFKNGNLDANHYKGYFISNNAEKFIYKPYLEHLQSSSRIVHHRNSSIVVIKNVDVPLLWYIKRFNRKIEKNVSKFLKSIIK